MLQNPYTGKLIVMEGLDGSGQSTQAGLSRDFLIKKGYQVILTKEPTLNSEAGKKVRQILDKKEKISPQELQALFVQDRKEHLEGVIILALKEGKIVISDRYFFSSFAYGTASGLDLGWLIEINNDFLLPDITFFLKVSPEICLKRVDVRNKNKERTLFEEKEKLAKVWQVYQNLPNRFDNISVINGEKSIEEVAEFVKKIIKKGLKI